MLCFLWISDTLFQIALMSVIITLFHASFCLYISALLANKSSWSESFMVVLVLFLPCRIVPEGGKSSFVFCTLNSSYKHLLSQAENNKVTHLTPTIWTPNSLAHSMRCLQFFRVVPNFIFISSSAVISSVAMCSKSLREGEDDWGSWFTSSAHVKPEDCQKCWLCCQYSSSIDGWVKGT